jgi:dTDP-4-dehydrorhamnose reductase
MKKILIFGSSGMLGKYLSKFLKEKGYEVERNDRADGGIDITKETEVEKTIKKSKAGYVINCAAFTDVNRAEDEREIAFKVNADAPGYMAKYSKKEDIPFIHVSTDYVFGDNLEEGYPEDYDNFNPLSVYGESKLEGEKKVLKEDGDSYIFRTSWLFGLGATNFIDKISKYAKELPELKVVTDEVGCPTYVGDLSERILLVIENKIEPGIYHACSSNHLSRYDFAKQILQLQNIDTPIKECKLEDFDRKAKVPNISIMLNTKLEKARTSEKMLEEYFGIV